MFMGRTCLTAGDKQKVDRRASSRGSSVSFFGSKAAMKEPTWEEAVAQQPDDAFTAYSMKETFDRGALIKHPTFGKGIVLSLDDRKMEVLFEDSKKRLAMGITPI